MTPDQKLFKYSGEDDPERCQGMDSAGQCSMKVQKDEEGSLIPGVRFCAKHGGVHQQKKHVKGVLNEYRLQRWQARVDEFTASEKVTSLAAEIGIMRMMIEELINSCTDKMELLMHSTRISDLVMKLDRLVNSFDKITNRQSNLLDKGSAIVLAGHIVEIISAEIKDTAAVDRISNGIIDLVVKLAGKEQDIL